MTFFEYMLSWWPMWILLAIWISIGALRAWAQLSSHDLMCSADIFILLLVEKQPMYGRAISKLINETAPYTYSRLAALEDAGYVRPFRKEEIVGGMNLELHGAFITDAGRKALADFIENRR